jgi:hypothetical protein
VAPADTVREIIAKALPRDPAVEAELERIAMQRIRRKEWKAKKRTAQLEARAKAADAAAAASPQVVGSGARPLWEDHSNVGLAMLQKLGWSEGQGLGRDGQGTTHAIAAVVKTDRTGLGMH